jgi:hypothetical protein
MEKIIGSAYSYMFKDSDWKYKLLVFLLLAVPSGIAMYIQMNPAKLTAFTTSLGLDTQNLFLLLTMLIVVVIAGGTFTGYSLSIARNVALSNHSQADVLPKWEENFWGFFVFAFLSGVAIFIAELVLIIPFLLIIPALVFYFILPALMYIFCTEKKVTSFLAWKTAFKIVGENVGRYFAILLLILVNSILSAVLCIVLSFAIKDFSLILLPFVLAYTNLVNFYLFGIVSNRAVMSASQESDMVE